MVETYIQLLGRRRRKRKISEKKYVKLLSQLMLWTVTFEYFDDDPDGGYFDYWPQEEEFDEE